MQELPIVSKLDEVIYGPADSLITKELIDEQIDRGMTADEVRTTNSNYPCHALLVIRSVSSCITNDALYRLTTHQAVKKKKLFMLDYHDMFLPYVHKVRKIEGTTLYGSRTLFFLTEEGTLRPIAIELTRPKSPAKPQWREVFTPGCDGSVTGSWLWQLAKTHVLAHDSGYHQLVSHWYVVIHLKASVFLCLLFLLTKKKRKKFQSPDHKFCLHLFFDKESSLSDFY